MRTEAIGLSESMNGIRISFSGSEHFRFKSISFLKEYQYVG